MAHWSSYGAYRASHRFHWISEPDKGMYDAINKGISLARGDVLAYLNSDDFYLPWSVDVAVRALQPGIELIYGDLGILVTGANGRPGAFSIQFYPDFDLRYYSFVGVARTANGLLASEPDGEDRPVRHPVSSDRRLRVLAAGRSRRSEAETHPGAHGRSG